MHKMLQLYMSMYIEKKCDFFSQKWSKLISVTALKQIKSTGPSNSYLLQGPDGDMGCPLPLTWLGCRVEPRVSSSTHWLPSVSVVLGASSSLGAPSVKAQYGMKTTLSSRERSVIIQIKVRICFLFWVTARIIALYLICHIKVLSDFSSK